MTPIDRRVLDPGLAVTTATLVAVFAAHHRGYYPADTCPACGHRFADDDRTSDCPTNTLVRPLLLRRHRENPDATDLLTGVQLYDLKSDRKPAPTPRPTTTADTDDLFDVTPYRITGGLR